MEQDPAEVIDPETGERLYFPVVQEAEPVFVDQVHQLLNPGISVGEETASSTEYDPDASILVDIGDNDSLESTVLHGPAFPQVPRRPYRPAPHAQYPRVQIPAIPARPYKRPIGPIRRPPTYGELQLLHEAITPPKKKKKPKKDAVEQETKRSRNRRRQGDRGESNRKRTSSSGSSRRTAQTSTSRRRHQQIKTTYIPVRRLQIASINTPLVLN